MVLIGNSEIGVHVSIDLIYLNWLKAFNYLESSKKSDFFLKKRPIFLYVYATFSELPTNISKNKRINSFLDLAAQNEIQVIKFFSLKDLKCNFKTFRTFSFLSFLRL